MRALKRWFLLFLADLEPDLRRGCRLQRWISRLMGQARGSARCSSGVQNPMTCSTPARLYQLRSKITISPAAGSFRSRCMYICVFSRSDGAGSATTRKTRGLTRSVMALRGNERIYPASVVKLFFLAAAHRWLEDKKIEDTPELRRALKDMIVDSSNEATQYIVDVLSRSTGGYELPPEEMKEWQYRRDAVNRYFSSLGYTNININQKTFCEDAYGREKVSRGPDGENRNKLTTDATARLLMEIATGKSVTPKRSSLMMDLLKRDYEGTSTDADDQAHGFTGIALQGVKGARLWSKAGWTSTTRHDVAYVELPDGEKFVLATLPPITLKSARSFRL